jgi:hypothetical protein
MQRDGAIQAGGDAPEILRRRARAGNAAARAQNQLRAPIAALCRCPKNWVVSVAHPKMRVAGAEMARSAHCGGRAVAECRQHAAPLAGARVSIPTCWCCIEDIAPRWRQFAYLVFNERRPGARILASASRFTRAAARRICGGLFGERSSAALELPTPLAVPRRWVVSPPLAVICVRRECRVVAWNGLRRGRSRAAGLFGRPNRAALDWAVPPRARRSCAGLS